MSQIPWRRRNATLRWSLHLSKALFDVKLWFQDFGSLSVSSWPLFGVFVSYLGPVFPSFPYASNTLKQVFPWFGTLGAKLFWIAKIEILTFLLAFPAWQIPQTLMKVWRFQKIRLYFFILHQIKNSYKLNLLFTRQNYNFDNIAGRLVSPNHSNDSILQQRNDIIPHLNGH